MVGVDPQHHTIAFLTSLCSHEVASSLSPKPPQTQASREPPTYDSGTRSARFDWESVGCDRVLGHDEGILGPPGHERQAT